LYYDNKIQNFQKSLALRIFLAPALPKGMPMAKGQGY